MKRLSFLLVHLRLEISKEGSFVVMCVNGTFEGKEKTYGHPSIIVVEIPEKERGDDLMAVNR